ncbi:MAG: HNH endonuclease [Acidimicrobiia bacterium]|nr:HNH endonuclease [Acidimicrobiia bacterium]
MLEAVVPPGGAGRGVLEATCRRRPAETAAEQQAAKARLHASATLGGTVELEGNLEPIGGAVFLAELARLERQLYRADTTSGVTRTRSQRQAEALVEMAVRSAGAETVTRARPLFSVLLGDETFAQLCEMSTGVVVTPGRVAPWLDGAWLETVLFDGPRTVVSVSHRRTFTGAVRRAVSVRDRFCQHPSGCDTPADECDVDHIVPYRDGGPTSQFNGRLECWPHNRDADRHDHDATGEPPRDITPADVDDAQRRWRQLYQQRHQTGDDGDDGDDGDGEDPTK